MSAANPVIGRRLFPRVTSDLVKLQISLGNIIQIIITVISVVGIFWTQGANQQSTKDVIATQQKSLDKLEDTVNKTAKNTDDTLKYIQEEENNQKLSLVEMKSDIQVEKKDSESYEKHLDATDTRVGALEHEMSVLNTTLEVLSHQITHK